MALRLCERDTGARMMRETSEEATGSSTRDRVGPRDGGGPIRAPVGSGAMAESSRALREAPRATREGSRASS